MFENIGNRAFKFKVPLSRNDLRKGDFVLGFVKTEGKLLNEKLYLKITSRNVKSHRCKLWKFDANILPSE